MSDNRAPIYARHGMAIGRDGIDWLAENGYIAIHYKDQPISTSEDEYKEAGMSTCGNKLKWFRRWSESGAVVGADYSTNYSTYSGGMVVGNLEPETPVTILVFQDDEFQGKVDVPPGTREDAILEEASGRVRDLFEAVKGREYDSDDGIRIYKGLKMTDTGWIWYRDYPVLLAVQLRRGTVTNWWKGETQLQVIQQGMKDLRKNVNDTGDYTNKAQLLAPGQLEVLCNEYLRERNDKYLQNLPVGRSLQDVDIVARISPDDERIMAQVTHAQNTDEIQEKADDLMNHAGREPGNMELRFFGPSENEGDLTDYDIIEYTSNEEVYRYMEDRKPELLDEMLTVPLAEQFSKRRHR